MADYLALVGRGGDDAAALEQLRFDSLDAHLTLFDDALPCLASLRERGLLLGLITNNEALHQRRKISSVGLDGLFDAVVISGEVGVAKPDEAIFAHACRAVGVEPSQALHVGDNLRADALGAYGAGLRGVWLDRDGRHDGRELQVPVITALAELTELLA
jgi:putative hydrolase of the HAD superfamily